MATAKKSSNVFTGLRCIHCGEIDSLSVKVDTLEVECRDCGETIEKAEVDAMVAIWARLFGWVETARDLA